MLVDGDAGGLVGADGCSGVVGFCCLSGFEACFFAEGCISLGVVGF